jgi:glycosyltransferase involved in cell wall biosynthesis
VKAHSSAAEDVQSCAVSRSSAHRPIRILELRSVKGTGGGPEKTILLGASRSDPDRFRVTVCYLRDRRDPVFGVDRKAAQYGVDYVEVIERHSFDPSVWRKLRQLIRDRRIDIVHAHEYKTDLLALLLARFEGVIPLSTVHGWSGNSRRERVYYAADRYLLRRYPLLVAVSDSISRVLVSHGVHASRIRCIRNGIDHQYFRHQHGLRMRARDALGIPADAVVLGGVGRLEGEKRFDVLIEAAAALSRPLTHVVLVGDGSQRGELTRLSSQKGIQVSFLGHQEDVRDTYHAFDIFVQASDTEGIPNAVLEAMALEIPVIATDVGGTSEIVTHGVHGLLVPRRSVESLVAAVEETLAFPDTTRRRVIAARARIETEFSFQARMAALEAIYETLVKTCQRPMWNRD